MSDKPIVTTVLTNVAPEGNKQTSMASLPSSDTTEVLPGEPNHAKLRQPDVSMSDLKIETFEDIADDIELERSPVDGACVVSAVKNGIPVCWYCFIEFAKGIPELEPAEIQVARPSGMEQGVRIKVHGKCHLESLKQRTSGKR